MAPSRALKLFVSVAVTLIPSTVPAAADAKATARARIHMVTFTTEQYEGRFGPSLVAKAAYAKHWGYEFEVFNEDTLRCTDFRPHRWRGDYRYCKLQALKVMWQRVTELRKKSRSVEGRRDYLFWHDVDTHIMSPETPLDSFLEAADNAPIVFTDNALSLNNGVFFLEVSKAGGKFLKAWRGGCRKGVWPWADNGCMYEVLLNYLGGDRYTGKCREFRENDDHVGEPPTGNQLMGCFNKEMDRMGMGCCGEKRGIQDFAFLTGAKNSFNHHPCHELLRAFSEETEEDIMTHCFVEGMFMVHTKNVTYVDESQLRANSLIAGEKRAEL